MNRKKLSRIKMRGIWIPGFVLVIIGFIHMKLHMIENEGTVYYMTKSPYLLKIKYRYMEYIKKMHMKTSELIQPIQMKLLDKEAEKKVLLNHKSELERKGDTLPAELNTGNETRAFIALNKMKDINVEELAKADAAIIELQKEIDGLKEHERLSIERMLELAISKAYSYVEGCQRAAREKSYYINLVDHDEQLFSFSSEEEATTLTEVRAC